MKESKFIEQNKENWLEFENNLKHKKNIASRLNNLFIQIADDLSYARTFYKHRSVKIYLNGVAQILFNQLYKNSSGTYKNFINFWKYDLPLQLHEARNEIRMSLAIFIAAFTIGIISSIYDKDFAHVVLGTDYVNMTLENIKNNDPLAVYKKGHQTPMFVSITVNNLYVSIYTFVFGAFFCAGSVFSLIRNAIMVGGFQYFFIEKGLFRESFLTIWQHGTLEISSIIIAGAAGITLGKGLIFPGTYSRIDSFKRSARRGLKIFVGIAPVIIIAAFIEGFITRYTNIGDNVRIAVIVFSLLFVLTYFGWYPWYISKRHDLEENGNETIQKTDVTTFNSGKILSAEEIFGQILNFAKKNVLWLFGIICGIAILHAIITVIHEHYVESFYLSTGVPSAKTFFTVNNNYWQIITAIISLSFLQVIVVLRINKVLKINSGDKSSSGILKLILNALFVSSLLILPFKLGFVWGMLICFLLSPLLFLVVYLSFSGNSTFLNSLSQLNSMLSLSKEKVYWNNLKITALTSAIYIMLNTSFVYSFIKVIYENFNYSEEVMYLIQMFIISFISVFLLALFFFLQISSTAFTTFSLKETVNAEVLKTRISRLGERDILFGFEKE